VADNPLLGPGVVAPRQNPLAPNPRDVLQSVLAEYMDPAQRGVGVNTVLGFTEGPATVGRFPMGAGRQAATVGDATVQYRVTPHAGVLVDDLYVAPEARGQGQGRALMQQLLAEIDAARLPSQLIAEPQEAGISFDRLRKFYRGLGYRSDRGNLENMTRKAAIGDGG
jgi:GNAT superfamily N-acetyltransferase